jgi:hypothetical protein
MISFDNLVRITNLLSSSFNPLTPLPAPSSPGAGYVIVLVEEIKTGLRHWWRFTAYQIHNQRDHEQHEENEEQDLGNCGEIRRDAAKAEQRGDERKDQKSESPLQHMVIAGI